MAKSYYVPGTYAEEVNPAEQSILAASTATGFMQGVFRKGPVNKALGPFRSLPEVESVFGGPEQTYKLWYNIRGFFKNGGQELYLNRIAHYTDITNAATRVGVVAWRMLSTADSGATSAIADGTTVATWNLDPGQTLLIDINNNGIETVTFDAAAAALECATAENYNLSGNETLLVKIDGGPVQTATILAGDIAIGGAATAEEVAVWLNRDLTGCSVTTTTADTKVTITSDKKGTDSGVQITGGTANAGILGFVTTLTPGTGDVGDIDAVTYAEAKTVIENDTTALTVSQLGSGALRLTSDTTGVASEIDISGGTARATLGLAIAVTTGAATSVENTLKLESGWKGYDNPGTEPNGHLKVNVYKNPLHPTVAAGSDVAVNIAIGATLAYLTDVKGITVGSIVKIYDVTNTEYRQVTEVSSVIVSGVLRHRIQWAGGLTYGYTAAAGQVESREFSIDVYWDEVLVEEWDGLTMLDTHDSYCETVVNDEATGSQYIRVTDQDATIGLGADIPADDTAAAIMTTAGTAEFTGLASTDYMGDATAKLGIHAADDIALLIDQAAFPGCSEALTPSSAVIALHYLSQWCASKTFIFPTFACPLTYAAAAAVTYRNTTFGLYSKYGSLEWPGVKVYDPLSSASKPMITVTSEGHIMGLRARVDAIAGKNDGGVWSSAAGEGTFGQLKDVMALEQDSGDVEQTLLHPISVNCSRKFEGKFVRYGARTLDSDIRWRYENVTRFFMFVEKSIVTGTRWAVHRNNNYKLWRRMEDSADEFLEGLMDDNAFPGATKAENYFVKVGIDKGTMSQADVDLGNVIGEIGLAPNKPGEFIVWRFSQFKSGGFAVE